MAELKRSARMKAVLGEYDVVRVVSLSSKGRAFSGSDGRKRSPQVGDLGTIVSDYGGGRDATAPVCVEAVDKEGFTLWLADFDRDELELVTKSQS